jgi:hypothetical protein
MKLSDNYLKTVNISFSKQDVEALLCLVKYIEYDPSSIFTHILAKLGIIDGVDLEELYEDYIVEVTQEVRENLLTQQLYAYSINKEYRVKAISEYHAKELAKKLLLEEHPEPDSEPDYYIDYHYEILED